MCATIAAIAVQITTTQIATAMAAEISDIVSSFTLMILVLWANATPDHSLLRGVDRV